MRIITIWIADYPDAQSKYETYKKVVEELLKCQQTIVEVANTNVKSLTNITDSSGTLQGTYYDEYFAKADVGGVISFSRTKAEMEDLFFRCQLLQRFADGIHYEVDEIIDIPFVNSLRNVLQDAYDLNPRIFEQKKICFFGKEGIH